ncbi:MAG: aminotransferase class I/II-fold pyridoxal phosphate-dependent enzyme [Propioniciclava sp.]|uniref:aminotransferase class I/II-fold pyridoxal phosphate-dependent enzyme n=1 Tax=Propioniciclava sp. TaxID=2038686 RepID=UPI0039E604D0
MADLAGPAITGSTAAEIADSVRDLIEAGVLVPGDALPSVRALAQKLDVNRNTVVAAYGLLARSGAVIGQGRAGTRIAGHRPVPQEGAACQGGRPGGETGDGAPGAAAAVVRDVGTGNPSASLIPDVGPALRAAVGRPVLYGEPVIDAGLEAWARDWFAPDVPAGFRLTVTSGAVDAVERLLAQALTRDDAVALEDPCFLASIHLARLGGYRAVAVPVDEEGMTVDGLKAALAHGVRAVICTPRAQNPTGVSLSARRAGELRAVLAGHPYVLVIEDDYYSLLSRRPFRSIVAPGHRRWALVRSVSKFIGPDICVALVASDAETASRLAMRLSPGTTWVSHLLQRTAHALLADPGARAAIERAGVHYAERNRAFAARLARHGLEAAAGDGINLWVPVPVPAEEAGVRLRKRGWLVRTGGEFRLDASGGPSHHLRLTVHDLDDADADALAADLAGLAGDGV